MSAESVTARVLAKLPALPAPVANGTDDVEATPKRTQATQLVELALERYGLGCAEDGRPFAVAKDGPNIARSLRGHNGLRQELAAAYFAANHKAPSSTALADALAVLDGRAQAAARELVALRAARHGAHIVLDLGDPSGRCVILTAGAWTIEARSPVLFRRSELTGTLPEPARGGTLDNLRALLNVSERDWPVLVGWLLAALLPTLAHPIALLTGEQGSGKTTAARLLVELVDPSPSPVRSCPRDVEAWVLSASGSWVVALDNLSGVSGWLSDALCRAVTGDALVRRSLYTDGDLSVTALRRVVLLTAIDAGAIRGDLADRLLTIELERIEPAKRLAESDLLARWVAQRPATLGALLDLGAQVMAVLPSIKRDRWPRMADFARVLAALDEVTGWSSLATYEAMAGRLAEDVIDADPVASAVRVLAEDAPWQGTAGELLATLNLARGDDRAPKGWPTTPRAMSGALRRCAPSLRALGLKVEYDGQTSGSRSRKTWTIGPDASEPALETEKEPTQPTQPTLPTLAPVDLGISGVGGCVGSRATDATDAPTDALSRGPDKGICDSCVGASVASVEYGLSLLADLDPDAVAVDDLDSEALDRRLDDGAPLRDEPLDEEVDR